MTVIVLWAHSRSMSTAFLRMMAERDDVTTVHEPLLHLTETGETHLPDGTVATDERTLWTHLRSMGEQQMVFVKEVLDYPYRYLLDHPADLTALTHTFIVRHPARTISSHYAMKNSVTCEEIGYERLFELFDTAWRASGRKPFVMRAEALLAHPADTVRAYCEYAGLPYRPEALHWQPGDRPEFVRHRAWHVDTIHSKGFQATAQEYSDTVENNPLLRSFYDHHLPFYERLAAHAVSELTRRAP
ncbi:MAG TPA: sulfotransferase family protein [Pseudonocardiaceae bacterium]|nr:sulfotransferase family protein [Pseudonocardiaceae bacterium]